MCLRYVLAQVFLLLTILSTTDALKYTQLAVFNPGCAGASGMSLSIQNSATDSTYHCLKLPGPSGMSVDVWEKGGGATITTQARFYATDNCTGTVDQTIDATDTGTCKDVTGFGGFKFVDDTIATAALNEATKFHKRINMGTMTCAVHNGDASFVYNLLPDACVESGLGNYYKVTKKTLSDNGSGGELQEWLIEQYFADAGCTTNLWTSPIAMLDGCQTSRVGVGVSGASATPSYPTTGTWKSHVISEGNAPSNTINYAKLRFYQDSVCTLPTTYVDPSTSQIMSKARYNGANVARTGVLDTSGQYFQAGEQVYDGNAIGQLLYLRVDTTGNTHVCTEVEFGDHAMTVNSASCGTGSPTSCRFFNTSDCSGTAISEIKEKTFTITTTSGSFNVGDTITGGTSTATAVVTKVNSATELVVSDIVGFFEANEVIGENATDLGTYVSQTGDCDPTIFAKVESFMTGVQWMGNEYQEMRFAISGSGVQGYVPNPTRAQECGGPAYIVQGLLDVCQVRADVSLGHTWTAPTELAGTSRAYCSLDWDTQYAAATTEATAQACKDRCLSDVTCLAVSYGRDVASLATESRAQNHKCVLCKDVTLHAHASWDTYLKVVTPAFQKVTTSTFTADSFESVLYTTSDCSGVGVADTKHINKIGTCRTVAARAAGGRDVNSTRLGSITLPYSTMTARRIVDAWAGQGAMMTGTNGSDVVGCPDVINYVYTEGDYTLAATTDDRFNAARECSILFQGPPGTTLSFDFTNFAISTGSCTGTPAQCLCADESVTFRDGLRADSNQVGQPMCGSTTPARMLFSGNTARIDFVATAAASTFQIWVSHHYTKVDFHLPANPTYQLGSDISIKWSIETSVAGWSECGTGSHQMTANHGVGLKTPYDEQWQRRYTCARSSSSDHGWVGIYRNGTCEDGAMVPHHTSDDPAQVKVGILEHAYTNLQQPHECYLAVRSIPWKETRGTVIFKPEEVRAAGWYSLRYFSGDSAGTLCQVLEEAKATDPQGHKNQQCLYSPISRGQIYVTPDRHAYSGATERSQLPGYERTVNY